MAFNEITVPYSVVEQFENPKGIIRVICSIKEREEFPCALNPRKDGEHIIIASKALIKKHRIIEGEEFAIRVRKDEAEGLAAPEELIEAFALDDWGLQLFEKLLPGKQRGLIYYIRSAKSIDTRIKRSFEIIEKLKQEALSRQRKK